jgi:hypothetical protein
MKSLNIKRALLNLLLIAVVVPVTWLALTWLTGRFVSGPSNNPWEGDAFLLNFLTLAPQMVLAGVVQQVVLVLIAPRLSSGTTRLAAIVLAWVAVPLVLIALLGGEPGIIAAPSVAFALAVAVTAYGLMMRLPLIKRA